MLIDTAVILNVWYHKTNAYSAARNQRQVPKLYAQFEGNPPHMKIHPNFVFLPYKYFVNHILTQGILVLAIFKAFS